MNADDRARAWAYLSRVAEPPCAELADLVAEVGPVEAADRVRAGAVNAALLRATEARRHLDHVERDLDLLATLGGRLVTTDDDEWPHLAMTAFDGARHRPRAIPVAPLVLWAWGPMRLADVTERSCAIVGTRAASAYGEHMAADLASGLVERDVAVVSGGAYGIDGVAHRATLAGDGVTVAVLAGGLDALYPRGHDAMLRRVAKEGLLLTEYPPGVGPARYRFLTRNRLVAAFGGATVVVEAGLRSGAASTAAWADALGRPVGAVPGPVTSSASAGCHVLLRNGAHVITRAADVVELVGRMGELADEPAHPTDPLDGLDDVARRVYDALPGRGTKTAGQIAVTAGIPTEHVLGPLAVLELTGLVTRAQGEWRLARR